VRARPLRRDGTGPFAALGLLAALAGTACRAPAGGPERLRIGVAAGHRDDAVLSPLVYGGGFHTKSLVYERLVTNDREGRLVPDVLAGWTREDGGRAWRLELPAGRRFHDGSPLDAYAVASHLRRVFADPAHRWTLTAATACAIEVLGPTTLRLELGRPHAAPADLAPLNPTGLVAPAAFEGPRQHAAIGSGPYRVVDVEEGDRVRYAAHDPLAGPPRLELVLLDVTRQFGDRAFAALHEGRVDALVDDWTPRIPRARVRVALARGGLRLHREPGSSVVLLAFNTARAPFDERDWRARVAAAIDRDALVAHAQRGLARPTRTLFGATVAAWPARAAPAGPPPGPAPRAVVRGRGELARAIPLHALPLRLLVHEDDGGQIAAARQLARQLLATGLVVQVQPVPMAEMTARRGAGDYELLLTRTWGLPYDPHVTLVARLSPWLDAATAVRDPPLHTSPRLTAALREALTLPDDEGARRAGWRRVQAVLDAALPLVPLYVPDHLALLGPRAAGLAFAENGYGLDLRGVR